jgi:anti-anti-sigma factor
MLTIQLERKADHIEAFPGSALEVEIEHLSPSIVVVHVGPEAGADEADSLARQLESAGSQDPRFVILDLARLTFLSRAALDCLVEFRRELCWHGGEVWLVGLQPRVWLALQAARLDGLFTVRDSLAGVTGS